MHPTPSGAVCDYASAVRFGGAGATHTQRSSECDTTASPSVECAQHGSTRVSETNTSVHPLDHVSDIAVSRASLSSCRLSARTTARDSIVHDTRPPLPTDAFAHTVDGATPAACAALSSDHLTAMTSKESDGAKPPPASTMSSAAKPYIPSYLAAVKKPVQPGGTGVVPIRVSDRPKLDWMTCSTVSNSLMDQESTSSWADDDENFLLSVTKTQRSMHVTASTRPSGDEAGRQASPREKGKPSGQGKGGKVVTAAVAVVRKAAQRPDVDTRVRYQVHRHTRRVHDWVATVITTTATTTRQRVTTTGKPHPRQRCRAVDSTSSPIRLTCVMCSVSLLAMRVHPTRCKEGA